MHSGGMRSSSTSGSERNRQQGSRHRTSPLRLLRIIPHLSLSGSSPSRSRNLPPRCCTPSHALSMDACCCSTSRSSAVFCSYCRVTSRNFSRDASCLACATATAARASCKRPELVTHIDQDLRLGTGELQLALLDVDGLLVDVVLAPSPVPWLPAEFEPSVGDIRRHEVISKRRRVLDGEIQVGKVLRFRKLARVRCLFHLDRRFCHLRILFQRFGFGQVQDFLQPV